MLKYRAFLSYSRQDRERARLLQRQLERHVLPAPLRLRGPGVRYDKRPLRPIFRDEDELVPGQHLPARIRAGLSESEFLIVLCSPAAAKSEWIGREICDFAALGHQDKILAVVADGEPNPERYGRGAGSECLPAALRFELDIAETVQVSGRPAEPLWLDWRKNAKRDRTMFLRLVAALLSLRSLDELIRRDVAYRRRQVAIRWFLAVAVLVAIVASGAVAAAEGRLAAIKRSETLASLARRAVDEGNWERAARYGLLGMRQADAPIIGFEPTAAEDALVGSLLLQRRTGAPRGLAQGVEIRDMSEDGSKLLAMRSDGKVQLIDAFSGKVLGAAISVEVSGEATPAAVELSYDGKLMASHVLLPKAKDEQSEFRVWDVSTGKQLFRTMKNNGQVARKMKFSRDGRKLAVSSGFGDGGGYLELFDLATAKGGWRWERTRAL